MFSRLARRTSLFYRKTIPLTHSNGTLSYSVSCPSCGAPLPTALPTCPRCHYIAPLPASMSYFHYFNLPVADSKNPFAIDTRDLRRRFLQAQRLCHPDAWAQKDERKLMLAAAQSSQLNKAYQTLLSPLERAHYILSLHGVEENELEKLEDEELITEVMEARQEIEEASSSEEISRIKQINKERIESTIRELEKQIGEENWKAAREWTVRLKYWLRIESAVKEQTLGHASTS
ncbi:Co-chaperone Hsc20 [Ramaria rubella]|nr:Co-chaperone Hsc20 [Ramaria rubella]